VAAAVSSGFVLSGGIHCSAGSSPALGDAPLESGEPVSGRGS